MKRKAPPKPVTPKAKAPAPEPKKLEPVKITAAKGRPMLNWVGKRPLKTVTAFPAQHMESFHPAGPDIAGGLLFHGDNKEVLAHLLANGYRGKVDLIYIDPPFDSGADYVRKVTLRGVSGIAKLDGQSYSLGEQIQYTDIWANDTYLQFMYERLLLLKEFLTESGSILVHCDYRKNAYLRILLNEVFTPECFQNEIIWKRRGGSLAQEKKFGSNTDTILHYSKSDNLIFIPQYTKRGTEEYVAKRFIYKETSGRIYRLSPLVSPSYSANCVYNYKGYAPPQNGWSCSLKTMEQMDREGKLVFPDNKNQRIQRKQYLDEWEGRPIQSLWNDIAPLNPQSDDRSDYPTQKPEELLQRIMVSTSTKNALVLDCFIGSGTTAAVAQKLGRRWIGCDINKGAIQTTSKRLQGIIEEQRAAAAKPSQKDLIADESASLPPAPASLGFDVLRVNDYDLQIQHNEAVNLACEHIGVTRTTRDGYFDGEQGKRLVKIIPFGHPLSPLHLEEVKRELKARKKEERDILIVCLGKEMTCDDWLADWNRLRKKGDVPNKIEVIELRTDAKYGKFIEHKPCQAKVKVVRKKDRIEVVVEDFISPSILERLSQQAGILKPEVTDWRSMVDCILIDPAYNGESFNISLSDIPEKKDDLVAGTYTLPAPDGKTTVAVKLIDMLGEEVLEMASGI
jgi:DNA modification methylase